LNAQSRDPTLSDPRHAEILRRLRAKFADTLELIRVA